MVLAQFLWIKRESSRESLPESVIICLECLRRHSSDSCWLVWFLLTRLILADSFDSLILVSSWTENHCWNQCVNQPSELILSSPTDPDKQTVLSEYQTVSRDFWLQMIGSLGSRASRSKNCNIWPLLHMPSVRIRRVGWNWVIFSTFSYGWLHLWPWYCGM
jgi:hypothetical protein